MNVKINGDEFWGKKESVISGWEGVGGRSSYMGGQSSHRIRGLLITQPPFIRACALVGFLLQYKQVLLIVPHVDEGHESFFSHGDLFPEESSISNINQLVKLGPSKRNIHNSIWDNDCITEVFKEGCVIALAQKKWCPDCGRNVTPVKKFNWVAFIFFLGVLYLPYYFFIAKRKCPICNGEHFEEAL